ncbi:23048_t:CDS:1, partial [Racocetra persica]
NAELLTKKQCVEEMVKQYATNMLILFQRVMKVNNQYPEIMKVQIVVQGLYSNLSLTLSLFMPSTLQE